MLRRRYLDPPPVNPELEARLGPEEIEAARQFVWRVLAEIPAPLTEAALFGSRARGDAGPESDVDILLVFRELPFDREPAATIAEQIAEAVADRSGVPLGSWAVSLPDLREGERTPMLVDALQDKISIWCWPDPLPAVRFTPADAIRCCDALLDRLEEGSWEFGRAMERGDHAAALRRVRDDLVRAGTALLLLDGITRPRRAEVPEALLRWEELEIPPVARRVLAWCRDSFGPDGKDEDRPIEPPPADVADLADSIDFLRSEVVARGRRLSETLGEPDSGAQFTD